MRNRLSVIKMWEDCHSSKIPKMNIIIVNYEPLIEAIVNFENTIIDQCQDRNYSLTEVNKKKPYGSNTT